MTDQEQHQQRVDYFNARYWKIAHYWFTTDDRTLLRDHLDDADRKCRFCDQGSPQVGFHELAHALPDFLGNRSIISLNECDDCNDYFGKGCEDNLSKATMLHRTLAGIPRKKGPKSTFKSSDESLRIDVNGHKVDMRVPAPNSVDDLIVDGELPDSIPLLGDTLSQPYVPIQAAMALVKIACSVCPKQELDQCHGAIEWVRGRRQQTFGSFPVLFAFTPGVFDERVSHIILLRRKDEGPEPYLWSVVQFRNFRFQVFVPFCPADAHWLGKADAPETRFEHYPSTFPPDWPKGPTRFHWFYWAGTEKVRTSWNVSHHMEKLISITRPPGKATQTEATNG
jgi:HNH endonuclease